MNERTRSRFAICSVVVIAALALGACGGSSKSGLASLGNKVKSNLPSLGGGSNNFTELVAKADKQSFKITYRDVDGSSETYEQDGKGDNVFTTSDGSQVFSTPKGTISCDTSSGKPACTEVPIAGSLSSPFSSFLTLGSEYLDALGSHLGSTSSKTIAGQSAECITFSAKSLAGLAAGGKASGEYCYDKSSGVLLSATGTDSSGKSSGFTVTSYGQPSASDFTPPATPSTVSIPSGITLPGGGTITVPGGGTIPGYPTPGGQ